jgi:Tfp pilus assembly protein PilF
MIREARLLAAAAVLVSACAHGGQASAPPADPLDQIGAAELFERGMSYRRRGDFVRAEQYVSAAVKRGYPKARALPVLIRACVASSRHRTALAWAVPYLEDHPADWRLRYVVATLFLAVGDNRRGRAELERVVATQPDASAPIFALAELSAAAHDRKAARRHYLAYLELVPDGPRADAARDWLDRRVPRRRARKR